MLRVLRPARPRRKNLDDPTQAAYEAWLIRSILEASGAARPPNFLDLAASLVHQFHV